MAMCLRIFARFLSWLRRLIFDFTSGVIHDLVLRPGFVFPTCCFAAVVMVSMILVARTLMLRVGRKDFTAVSTTLRKLTQFTPFVFHFAARGMTGCNLTDEW